MFKTYTDGKRKIKATEKAYEVIYKTQGFRTVAEEEEGSVEGYEVEEGIETMSLDQLKDYAKELGLTGYSKLNKDELQEVIKDTLNQVKNHGN